MNDGILTLCELVNTAEPGAMPKESLRTVTQAFFEARTVGFSRQYEAKGVNERVDMLVRIWREYAARIGMYVVITDYTEQSGQYRIDNVQHLYNDDGLQVTDLTLYRLDDLYEVIDREP